MQLNIGDTAISTNPSLRQYGVGRVLMVKNGIAKVSIPRVFFAATAYAHTKLLKIEESGRGC